MLAQLFGRTAEVMVGEEVEVTLLTDTAASGDFGEGEVGEAQKVGDEPLAIFGAEVVAGLTGETADESAEVTAGAAEAAGKVCQRAVAKAQRLQQQVGGVDASRMEISHQWAIAGLAVVVVVTGRGERRYVEVVQCMKFFLCVHSS